MTRGTRAGFLAIKLPPANKIEAQVKGGIALTQHKHELLRVELVMDYKPLDIFAGQKVLLRGDAGFQAWAREVLTLNGQEFVLCPEQAVIGYEY